MANRKLKPEEIPQAFLKVIPYFVFDCSILQPRLLMLELDCSELAVEFAHSIPLLDWPIAEFVEYSVYLETAPAVGLVLQIVVDFGIQPLSVTSCPYHYPAFFLYSIQSFTEVLKSTN
jgi:hypothetical protein